MRGSQYWIWLVLGLLLLNPLSVQARPSKKKKKPPQSKKDKRKLVRRVSGKGLLRVLRFKKVNRSLDRMLRSLKRTPRLTRFRKREGL